MTQPAPYFSDVTDTLKGAGHFVTTEDGIRIRAVTWPCAGARGTVVIFPGRTEYCEKYAHLVPDFHAAKLCVAAVDWRGQGLSQRQHPDPRAGHVEDFAEFQTDATAYLAHLQALGLPQPYYLLAHSMGGCIALRRLVGTHPFEKAAFSGPMWGIAYPALLAPLVPAIIATARRLGLLQKYAPGTSAKDQFEMEFNKNPMTSDRGMWDHIHGQMARHPELALGGPTLAWLQAAQAEMTALAALPSPTIPALALLGGDEAVVSPKAIRNRMARWQDGRVIDLPKRRHESLMEGPALRDPVLQQIIAHFS